MKEEDIVCMSCHTYKFTITNHSLDINKKYPDLHILGHNWWILLSLLLPRMATVVMYLYRIGKLSLLICSH